jgi:hypothetical protein
MRAVNPISEHFREQATAQRARAAERPDDARYVHSAKALEALADYADVSAEQGAFQMRYLLEHHVVDGRFAWTKGQCGRSVMQFGFDVPVRGEDELDQFLMDLCDRAKSDAARHIGENESEFDRDDARAIATRFGIDVDRVHGALDAGGATGSYSSSASPPNTRSKTPLASSSRRSTAPSSRLVASRPTATRRRCS